MAMAQYADRDSAAKSSLSLAQRVILAEGWTRRLIAFGAGAVGALAMAPFDFAPAMFVTLTIAVWLIDGSAIGAARFAARPLLAAAGAGWWLGFGYFLAGLWWLGAAMLVEADQFAWALPLAVIGLPAALACFPALGFGVARLLWSSGSARIFALAVGLGGAEWLRGHILTGFPWNDIGMALTSVNALAQTASLVGIHGLDLLAILIFAAPATLAERPPARRNFATGAARIAALLLVAMLGFGYQRLASGETDYVEGVKLRLMQPNLQQDAKFRPENGASILRNYLALSDRATSQSHTGVADVTHLLWPESAFPYILMREPQALSALARMLQGKILITGAARTESDGSGKRGKIFNSIEVLQNDKLVDHYDKRHLVPFGEFLPLDGLLRPLGVSHLVPGVWDVGEGPRRLLAPGLPPISPLICYEAIFSGEVVAPDAGAERPHWLLNVTNDGWFGRTTGPYQHLAQARLRAIEEGLPLIRVANTGVSAVIDPYGRILQSLPLGEEGVIDSRLPKPAGPTVFSRLGVFVFPALWGAALFIAAVARLRG